MSKPLKAHELVAEVAGLVRMQPELLAQVANVPVKNLLTWLEGKQQNLLSASIKAVMNALGVNLGASGVYLSADRVHFWHLSDTKFGQRKGEAYDGITRISKLLADCIITEVLPAGRQPPKKGFRYFLLAKRQGSPVRVVLRVDVGRFRQPRINPEVLRGAMWRSVGEQPQYVMPVPDPVYWARIVNRDLTTHEFDWVFDGNYDSHTWSDVGLAAREAGVRPCDLMGYIHQRVEQSRHYHSEPEDRGVISLEDKVVILRAG